MAGNFQDRSRFVNWATTFKLITVLIFVFSSFSCTSHQNKIKTKFTGTHTTANIRVGWLRCYTIYNAMTQNRNTQNSGVVCDCFVDKIRATFTTQELNEQEAKKEKRGYADKEYEAQIEKMGEECSKMAPLGRDILFRNNPMRSYDKALMFNVDSIGGINNVFHQPEVSRDWQNIHISRSIRTDMPCKEYLF